VDAARETTLSADPRTFDPALAYTLHAQVSIRPEPFGGLAYNYDNRRLTLITARSLVDVVHALADHASAREAVAACVPPADCARHESALATLYDSGVIHVR
jgi:mycofactocin biosynthesis protein MftB